MKQGYSFQFRVVLWMRKCFGTGTVATSPIERNFRFLEEALELVQANGCTADEARTLVDYVFNRPVGVIEQEVGGVMVTLAALCATAGVYMDVSAEEELHRIGQPAVMAKIRAKQASKPQDVRVALPGREAA